MRLEMTGEQTARGYMAWPRNNASICLEVQGARANRAAVWASWRKAPLMHSGRIHRIKASDFLPGNWHADMCPPACRQHRAAFSAETIKLPNCLTHTFQTRTQPGHLSQFAQSTRVSSWIRDCLVFPVSPFWTSCNDLGSQKQTGRM